MKSCFNHSNYQDSRQSRSTIKPAHSVQSDLDLHCLQKQVCTVSELYWLTLHCQTTKYCTEKERENVRKD